MAMSETTNTTTRRSALARLALLAGGAVGIGVAGKTAVDRGDENPVAAPQKRKTQRLVLHGRDWRLALPGEEPGAMPPADAVAAPIGVIVDRRRRELGAFRAAALPGLGGAFQLHTFDLEDGTILGIGANRLDDADFAIVGGTGRYAGATGTYRARQFPRELGGDGTAEFTLTLNAWEA
jgi:hypothetical protein